jgi:4-amino-4-deoxy-L-arabinose transferase-like glycosyltransferase
MSRQGPRIALLLLILLVGLALRLAPWGQNRFLEDEALYGYWGLQIATAADPMLDYEPLDKPPLHPYVLALSFLLTSAGQVGATAAESEMAARLPSLFASMASIALVCALGTELFKDARAGLLAAALLALSPFDILFASTAFTDPLMTAWVLGALLAGAEGHLGAAGVLAGLAAATKQQGLFFLPLVAAVALLRPTGVRHWRRWLRFVIGLGLVTAGTIWWDSARMQRPGFWAQSLISYGGLGPAQPQALGARAIEWLRLAVYFWVSPWFMALLGVTLMGWMVRWWIERHRGRRVPQSNTVLALAAFVAGFLALHWLVGFRVWDRYLLALVPVVALLAAKAFVDLGRAIRPPLWRRAYTAGLGIVLAASLTGPVVHAAGSELPVGGDHGAYDGIDELAAYVRSQVPAGSVLYHYWLGYHYRFYLYGALLRMHWYPDLEDLTRDATVYRREPRYIAFPSWRDDAPVRAALSAADISLVPVFETSRRDGSVSFRLYRLEGPQGTGARGLELGHCQDA